jgi:hypothetical protein
MFARVTPVLFRTLALATLLTGALARFVPVDLQMFPVVSAQEPSSSEVGFVPLLGDPANRAVQGEAAVGNMTYHGGPVQHAQKVFTIFWNPTATPFPVGYQTTINQFVQDLNGSPYYAIASQYGDSTSNISTAMSFGGTWLDTTNGIAHDPPTINDLQNEVTLAQSANGWTADANSYFQVWHDHGLLRLSRVGGSALWPDPVPGISWRPRDLPSLRALPERRHRHHRRCHQRVCPRDHGDGDRSAVERLVLRGRDGRDRRSM